MRWALPQPYVDLDHTADVGIAVDGATPEEALARLVLGESALLSGGAPVGCDRELRVEVEGTDRASVAVECLRELLFLFATSGELACWCDVEALSETRASITVGLGRWDPERHGEGMDLKAVTWHAAGFAPSGERWHAQVLFDI